LFNILTLPAKMKVISLTGSVFCLFSVVLGAFAAHSLKQFIEPSSVEIFQTGVKYQFYHGLAILFCGLWYKFEPISTLKISALLFSIGIFLFSGSLYLLSFKAVIWLPLYLVGPATPIGGVFFIAGWGSIIYTILKSKPININE